MTALPPSDQPRPLRLRLERLAVAPPGREPVLSGVTLDLAPGECLAVIGPSGAGKTTLLRTLALMIAPASGHLAIDGTDPVTLSGEALRRLRSRVAIVTQRHDLVEPLSVHQNVMAGALGRWSTGRALRYLLRPRAGELAEAHEALAAVGLADKLREPTRALSGGQQQRVAIARALVQAPSVLLADEPVASLDPASAAEVLGLLTGLARERGMALVCALHQPDLARAFCDRVVEAREGRIMPVAAVPAL